MPLKVADHSRRRSSTRRKVALACDSCREKKVRCDGIKPICGSCTRRAYRIDQCVYNTDNARSASRDEYLQTLCQRIKELEDACLRAGVSIETSSRPQARRELHSEPNGHGGVSIQAGSPSLTAPQHSGEAAGLNPGFTGFGVSQVSAAQRVLATRSESANSQSGTAVEATECTQDADAYESPLFDGGIGHITGMGQIMALGDESRRQSARFQFYGSSSTASLMRFARQSMPSQPENNSRPERRSSTLQDTFTQWRFDDFVLPPRALADHLVSCFFNHVYTLYPFFHRPAFEAAYRNLWRAGDEPQIPLTDLRIGLGSDAESGPKSILFHAALNSIFALGCQFADIVPEEVELVANTFFLRTKRFIGLDLLDINTLGVVQTLLITALFLQSSPYPSRCWHSIGVACRVALGLGLHEAEILTTLTPLESDIRRRTWHGCVMMDVTLSMTYGRPTMTTHLAPLPPPDASDTPGQDGAEDPPSLMAFYTEAIKLHGILNRILSDVYYAWRGRSRQDQPGLATKSPWNLDIILEIERQLTLFEANLPSFLKWSSGTSTMHSNRGINQAIAQQRNVLHARYLHLHLLLHRPIFTQIYSERVREREAANESNSQGSLSSSSFTTRNTLYSSMATKSATACVMAAIDLTHLVHQTYYTRATDSWWYNGFYVSTAAIVLLMSFFVPSTIRPSAMNKARAAWREATRVLESMTTVSISASNTLRFLRTAYHQAAPGDVQNTGGPVTDVDPSLHPNNIPQTHEPLDNPDHDFFQVPFYNWEQYAANMGQGLDDIGFLTRLDFPDISS